MVQKISNLDFFSVCFTTHNLFISEFYLMKYHLVPEFGISDANKDPWLNTRGNCMIGEHQTEEHSHNLVSPWLDCPSEG